MLNRIIKFSLDNRLLVVAGACLLAGAGVLVATRMEVDVFPDLNAPTVVVMTEAAGMAPEEVERTVTFVVETAVNGAEGVRRVRSSSAAGFSVVWVEFDWGMNVYTARQIVSEKLAAMEESLPPGAGQPILGPQSSILGEVLIIGLTSDQASMEQLRTIADWTVRPRLLSAGGVAQVSVIGGDIKEYQVLLSPGRMRFYGVRLDEVVDAATNINLNSSGGVLYQYGNEYLIRGVASTDDIELLGKGVVKTTDAGAPVRLEDVASVRIGPRQPQLGSASVEGAPAVLLTVTKQPGTGTIELTARLDRIIDELRGSLPDGVVVSTDIFRQSRFIESSIDNIRKAIIEGAIFVVIILFIFLMNGRVTVISLTALPLSLLVAVLVLKVLGITINTMSLGGMAIAIGSLVDDAVIDVENVFKRLRENRALPGQQRQGSLKVIYDASVEIRSSIVNATLITIVAFLPLFFLGGMEGRMLKPLGVSFIVSLFASLLVAMTLTPVMCSYMLTGARYAGRKMNESRISVWMRRWYIKALEWVLRHKKTVVASAVALLAGTLVLFFTLGSGFLPPFNEGSLTINVSAMPGISLEGSDQLGRRVEQILLEIPEIKTVARKTGRAELDEHALGVNASEIEAPFELSGRSRTVFMADVRERLSRVQGVSIEIGQPISHRIDAMLSGTKASIAVKVFGEDIDKLYALAGQIKRAVEDVEGIADLNVEQLVERPQLQIIPRREMLARYGISMSDFSQFVEVVIGGRAVSQVYDGAGYFDLTVKADDNERADMEGIGNLLIDASDGTKIPLDYVADIVSGSGPNTISRENVKRRIVISANTTGGDLGGVVDRMKERIESDVPLPEGYYVEFGGQFESRKTASRTLMLASLGALLLIFLLLYQEFRSVSLSAMVMLNLPLAMIGGIIAIRLTSGILSIPAIIGFISLLGIAVRNGILLVSRYGQLRQEGYGLTDSVLRGSSDRLLPIVMTSLTSALALIPLALGGEIPGNEIQSPMAIVILGGLLSSMLLNGFVIPVVYILFNRKKDRS